MKKLILLSVFISFTMIAAFSQATKLAVGMKAPDWVFTDADKKEFSMKSWEGKVLQVNYVDPDESELNEPFNEAVNKAVDVDKRFSRQNYQGFGIVDCKSTWKPNGLIRSIAGKKARKFKTTILFDYDGKLQDLWGMPKDGYTIVILDKNRICRALYTGKIPQPEFEKAVQLIEKLVKE